MYSIFNWIKIHKYYTNYDCYLSRLDTVCTAIAVPFRTQMKINGFSFLCVFFAFSFFCCLHFSLFLSLFASFSSDVINVIDKFYWIAPYIFSHSSFLFFFLLFICIFTSVSTMQKVQTFFLRFLILKCRITLLFFYTFCFINAQFFSSIFKFYICNSYNFCIPISFS